MNRIDQDLAILLGSLAVLLVMGTIAGQTMRKRADSEGARAEASRFRARIQTWWVMAVVLGLAVLMGPIGSSILFGLTSFWALREFITLTPTHRGDHRSLFWAFFVFTPLQYYLLARGWYGFFIVLIPVYAFLFIPLRTAMCGDYVDFLSRTAKIQWGLMICVYCLSHAPAVLTLEIPGYEGEDGKLLLFLVVVAQAGDVLQNFWDKVIGKRLIAPGVCQKRTVEGFLAAALSAMVLGSGLWWATPFNVWQAGALALAIAVAGLAGELTTSAIKRDRGVEEFGGHHDGQGGVMDRIASICFAAPIFFHMTRYWFT